MTESMFFTLGRNRISGRKTSGLRPNTETEAEYTNTGTPLLRQFLLGQFLLRNLTLTMKKLQIFKEKFAIFDFFDLFSEI